jgi:hypothetical protein
MSNYLGIAVLLLDETAIRAHFEDQAPTDSIEFWEGVHRCRLSIPHVPAEMRRESFRWLKEHERL